MRINDIRPFWVFVHGFSLPIEVYVLQSDRFPIWLKLPMAFFCVFSLLITALRYVTIVERWHQIGTRNSAFLHWVDSLFFWYTRNSKDVIICSLYPEISKISNCYASIIYLNKVYEKDDREGSWMDTKF